MPKHVSAEEQMMSELAEEIERVSDAIASEMGPAPDVEHLSAEKEVEFWGMRDPLVDYDTLVQVLQTTGISPEMMDPKNKQGLAIAKVAPQLGPLYTQPVQDPALAHQLAILAEWPMRYGFYANKSEKEMVAIAKRMDAAWAKKAGVARYGEEAPMPLPPVEASMTPEQSPMMPEQGMASPAQPMQTGAPQMMPPDMAQMMGG
jgi:hypothetical protein